MSQPILTPDEFLEWSTTADSTRSCNSPRVVLIRIPTSSDSSSNSRQENSETHDVHNLSQLTSSNDTTIGSLYEPPQEDNFEQFKEALKTLESCSNLALKQIEKKTGPSRSSSNVNPVLLHANLKDYQKTGMQWLYSVFFHGCEGAILGDEMGLGKTVQLIAFLCKVIEQEVVEPNLIVCPLSVLDNWEAEFKKFAPHVPVIKFYGSKEDRQTLKKKLAEPCKTVEYSTSPAGRRRSKVFKVLTLPHIILTTPKVIDKEYAFLKKTNWNCIVVDEGHSVKNSQSNLSKQLSSLKSAFKVLLTGTPLQNNLRELWNLLEFVQPSNRFDFDKFEEILESKISSIDDSSSDDTSSELGVDGILTSLHNILKPYFLHRTKQDVDLELPRKKAIVIYCPLVEIQEELYTRILKKSIETNYLTIDDTDEENRPLNTPVEIEETMPSTNSTSESRKRRAEESSQSTDEPSRKRRKCAEQSIIKTKMLAREEIESSDDEEELEDFCQSVTTCAETSASDTSNTDEVKYVYNYKLSNVSMCLRKIINHPYLVKKPYKVMSDGKKEMVVDDNIITQCGKMIVLNQLLAKLKATNHKVLVFCTMTKALDLIEEMCIMKNYNYHRLDGRHSNEDRNKSVKQFNTSKAWSVFLVSTRAGGQGLNLVGADTCIIYDCDWNPQVDRQAEARCHRIGQTKPVCTFRLVTKNTLDEIIYETAQSKLRLGKIVLPEHLFKFNTHAKDLKIDVKELLVQIRAKTEELRVCPDGNVYTDVEIENFLDRSDLMG